MASPHLQALRRAPHRGGLIGLFGGTLGLWASTARLSGAVLAPGQFVVDTNVKKVQQRRHRRRIAGARGRPGRRRRPADRLDETITRANLQIVTKQLDELEARQARLEAERDGAGGALPAARGPAGRRRWPS